MTVTVRLDEETRKLLNRLVRMRRLSRSEVIRRGIRLLAAHDPSTLESNPAEIIGHLVGRIHGGPPDLSERTGDRFRKALTDKRAGKR